METFIYRTITLSSGWEVKIYPSTDINKLANFEPVSYNRTVMECQIENCGYIICDAKFGDPIDDEFALAEVYEILKS